MKKYIFSGYLLKRTNNIICECQSDSLSNRTNKVIYKHQS